MTRYFKNEMKRALLGKSALISFLIALVVLVISFLAFLGFPHYNVFWLKRSKDAIDVFINIRDNLVVIFPLLATIIFSDSYLLEKQTGFTKFIYSRMSLKRYVWIKFTVNALTSAVVGCAASFIMLVFLIFTYGIGIRFATERAIGPFSYLLSSNRLGYGLIVVLTTGLCYMTMATLAMGLSAWIKNRYLVLIIPFFYYILCGTLLEILGVNFIFNLNLAQVYGLNYISTWQFLLYPILLVLLGFSLFYRGVILKNEKDL
ncbi:ABC-2 family transporter protein [Peptococcaceae bacterium CEB3]|nr:ABC-2 family transporter protein [Peptococcaceae bacterium CEB3]